MLLTPSFDGMGAAAAGWISAEVIPFVLTRRWYTQHQGFHPCDHCENDDRFRLEYSHLMH